MALYFGTDKIQKVAVKFEGLSGTDTSDATLTSGDQMLEGVSAYSKGKKYSGTIPTKDVATPSISVSADGLITATNVQLAGYTSGATKTATQQLTAQAAKTVTPTTTEQTAVDSGVYTTGAVKVGAIQTETKNITSNGEHTPTSGKYFSSVTVDVQPNLQTKTVTPSESAQTVSADSSYQGLSSVTVNAISNQYIGSGITQKAEATITPGTTDQTLEAGQYLAGAQTIQGDANLIAGNIASGVSIFGVTGTHSSGVDTSDATATSADILSGKTAYVNGAKITGSYGIATATVVATSSSDASSISFTVAGQPIAWSIVQTANTRDWGNTRFICACNSNGNSTSMTTESQYGRQYAYSNYITSEYSDGTLTVSTSNSSNSGTFRGGTSYQLLYVYENIVEVEPEPDLPEGEVGSISSDNVISLADSKLPAGTYTMYYESEDNSKLEGWGAIGTISKGGAIE